jgi:predicted deacylase
MLVNSPDEIRPGSRGFYRVPVTVTVSGVPVSLAFHVVRGAASGPTLGLISTSHGGEFLSIEQVRAAVTGTDPGALCGTVIACAVANPLAFEQGRMTTPVEDQNMNRIYPGTAPSELGAKYAGGVTEWMTHLVTRHVIEPSDVVLDFHLGPHDQAVETIDVPRQAQGEARDRLRAMGSLFGTTLHEWDLFPGSAVGYAVSKGKLALGVEIGGGGFGGAQSEKWVGQAAAGVRGVLQTLGMLPGEPHYPAAATLIGARTGVRPRYGGYHVPAVRADHMGTWVEEGQLLGRTYDTQTFELLEELRSPHRGVLYMVRGYAPVHPGDWAYVVGRADGISTWAPPRG